MKAYLIFDKDFAADYEIVVFAQSRGKAIYSAIGTEEFPKHEWGFTDLRARRMPELDSAYRGRWRMEWDDADDRLALVRDARFSCSDEIFEPEECEECSGKEYCGKYEEYQNQELIWE